jgi:hypothetical protein
MQEILLRPTLLMQSGMLWVPKSRRPFGLFMRLAYRMALIQQAQTQIQLKNIACLAIGQPLAFTPTRDWRDTQSVWA